MRTNRFIVAAAVLSVAIAGSAGTASAKQSRKAFLGQEASALTQLCIMHDFSPKKVAAGLRKRGFTKQPWFGKGIIGVNYPGSKGAVGVLLYMPEAAPCAGIQVAPVRIPFVTGTMAATLKNLGFTEAGKGNHRDSRWSKGNKRVRINSRFSANISSGVSRSGIAIRPDQ